MRRVTINDTTTNRTAPQQPRQRCPEGLVTFLAVPLPKNPNIDHNSQSNKQKVVTPVYDQVQPEIFEEYMKTTENTSPLSFLSSRLSQFTKATRIFTTRDYTHTNVAAEFHQACDNIPNTLVIIKSGQYIAGGYTEVAWSSPASMTFQPLSDQTDAFLFSVDQKELFSNCDDRHGIICYHNLGPAFGQGDLIVSDDYHSTKNMSNLSIKYSNPQLPRSKNVLFGSGNFTIDEYEVYKLE